MNMYIDKKYYKNYTVHRSILGINSGISSSISCGFLHKTGDACIHKNILFEDYGALYVLSGTGVYTDTLSGRVYPIYPGCVVQRMPNQLHDTVIKNDGQWLEFYFCFSGVIFEALTKMGLICDSPVFFVGNVNEIFYILLRFLEKVELSPDNKVAELIFDVQKLLFYLNDCNRKDEDDDSVLFICDLLKQNLKVGTNLNSIAKRLNMSYETMRKKFKKSMGCSLSQYIINERINKGKSLLLDLKMRIKNVAMELGYFDEYAFSKQFKKYVGVSPSEFVRNWSNNKNQ
jgi:AraC family transcriptional regulator of arabinose operon